MKKSEEIKPCIFDIFSTEKLLKMYDKKKEQENNKMKICQNSLSKVICNEEK